MRKLVFIFLLLFPSLVYSQSWPSVVGTVRGALGLIRVDGDTSKFDRDLVVEGDIGVNTNIYHNGDPDTYMNFSGDEIAFIVGNQAMLELKEAATDLIRFNGQNNDVNVIFDVVGIEGALFVEGSSGNVGMGTIVPSVKLEIEGGISIGDTTGFVLSSAAATITSESNVILDTEAGVALDTCTTLTGVIGQIIYISTRNSARDIDFLDAGNFSLAAECNLTDVADVLVLKATSATTWKGLGCNNNN